MYGSCCEEQEAQEAAARDRVAKITRHTENQLMRGHIVRRDLARQLRCPNPCCAECGNCDDDEEGDGLAPLHPEAPAAPRDDDDDDGSDLDEDAEEEAFMARMRATRLEQMRASAHTQAQRLAGRGMHARLRDDQPLASLLSDASDDSPLIVHIPSGDDAPEASLWVEDVLRKGARELPFARLVSDVSCPGSQPPDCLPFLVALPALIVVERGLVSSVCDGLRHAREPEAVRAVVSAWLQAERTRLAAAIAAAKAAADDDDDDDDDDGPAPYCGRPGCRAYPHEHVGSKQAGGDGMPK